MIRTLVVGQMAANCHIISDRSTMKALIVDPGDEPEFIMEKLTQESLDPVAVVATHGHFDHIMAASALEVCYGIPFMMHPNDVFLLSGMAGSAKHFLGLTPVLPAPSSPQPVREGDEFRLGRTVIRFIEVPGHTPGSIALYDPEAGYIVVGDLMFEGGGVGRTDFTYSNPADLAASVRKILAFPDSTRLRSGHGESTTVGAERRYFSTGV